MLNFVENTDRISLWDCTRRTQVCRGLRTQQVGGQYANVDKLGIIMFIIAAELH